jgi:hypothetical protein
VNGGSVAAGGIGADDVSLASAGSPWRTMGCGLVAFAVVTTDLGLLPGFLRIY